MTMYHVTGRRNVVSIMARGLRTNAAGFDAGYVWLFDDLALALAMAKRSFGGSFDNVIIEVDVDGLDIIDDPHPGWGDWRDAHSFVLRGDYRTGPSRRVGQRATMTAGPDGARKEKAMSNRSRFRLPDGNDVDLVDVVQDESGTVVSIVTNNPEVVTVFVDGEEMEFPGIADERERS